MKILIVPDIHLGKGTNIGKDPIGVGLNSKIIDQKNLLNFIYEQAIAQKVERIILLGDIWDDVNPKPAVVYVFLDWLIACTNANIFVDIIHGNHDYVRSGLNRVSMLDCVEITEIDKCNVFKNIQTINFRDLAITYIPFTDRRQLNAKTTDEALQFLETAINKSASAAKRPTKITVGHLALEGSLWIGDEISDDANELFCPIDMFNAFEYVFMGHIHTHQIINNSKPFAAHVGSIDHMIFSDTDNSTKHIVLFDSADKSIKTIKLPCRNLINIEIDIPADTLDETEYVMNYISKKADTSFKDSIVKLKIETIASDAGYVDKEKVNSLLNNHGIFHISSFNEIKRNERVLNTDIDIDEGMDHFKAVDMFMSNITADNNFKKDVALACKEILKVTQRGSK